MTLEVVYQHEKQAPEYGVEFMATVPGACVRGLSLDGYTLPHTELAKYFSSRTCIQHKREVI